MIKLLKFVALIVVSVADPTPRVLEKSQFSDGRIIGGEDAPMEKVGHQVSIAIDGSHICGGSIIAENWVVTAAHCSELPINYYTIRAGTLFNRAGGTLHRVSLIKAHENFTIDELGVPSNDVAVFRISDKFILDNHRSIIKLFDKDEVAPDGATAVVTGWGTTSPEDMIEPSQLQTVNISIISQEECNKAYRPLADIDDSEICAGYAKGGKDSCQGDSGGPMVVGGRLAGIVSWGRSCGDGKYPGVYAKVAYYNDWIKDATNSCGQLSATILRFSLIATALTKIVPEFV